MSTVAVPNTKFVIFATARSGSSFLTTSLRSHPDILCHGEVMHPRQFAKHVHGSALKLPVEQMESDPVGFANSILSIGDGCRIVGFKIFPTHAREAHPALLADSTISKVVLRRHNMLAAYSSLQLARSTGLWNTDIEGRRGNSTVPFNAENFERYRQKRNRYYEQIDKLARGPRTDVSYEEHIMAEDVSHVVEFLGADMSAPIESSKKKLYGRSIIDRFDDRAIVEKHLSEIGKLEWAYE